MKKIAYLLIPFFAVLMSKHSVADDSSYYSVGYLTADAKINATAVTPSLEADVSGITVSYNQKTSENITIEYEFALGMGDDDIKFSDGWECILPACEASMDHSYGIYGSYALASNESFTPYVKFGATRAKLTLNDLSDSSSDISYGIGATVENFQIEYMNYYDKDGLSLSGLSLNYLLH
jgi:hypothetical protein